MLRLGQLKWWSKFAGLAALWIFILAGFSNQVQAQGLGKRPVLHHVNKSTAFQVIMMDVRMNPQILENADTRDRILFPASNGKTYAVDLIFTDLIDQAHYHLKKKKQHAIFKHLLEVIDGRPVENFVKWWDQFIEYGHHNRDVRRAKAKLVVQLYNGKGEPLPFKLQLFRKGRFSRYERKRRGRQYSELLNDAEGRNIVRYISNDRLIKLKRNPKHEYFKYFPSTRPTVFKFTKYKKQFTKYYKRHYYKNYFEVIKGQEALDFALVKKKKEVVFSYKFKEKRAKPVVIKAGRKASKDFKNVSTQVFNTIHALPYKLELLKYLQAELKDKYDIKIPERYGAGLKHLVLTPSFVHAHRQQLLPLIKEYTYIQLFENVDIEYFLHLRRWVRKHYDEIKAKANAAGLPWKVKRRGRILLPRIAEIMEAFPVMEVLYPDTPWNKKMPVLYDRDGKPVYLVGRFKRLALKARDYVKKLIAIENISGMVVGGLTFALTGNPMLSGALGSLTRDGVRMLKYDLPLKSQIPVILRNVGVSLILGAGFASGRLAEQIILGGMAGAAQSLVTRRRVDVGALVGAIQSVLLGLLPRSIAHPTVAGLGADAFFKNALIELLERSFYAGMHGLVVSLVTNEEVVQGVTHGMLYGLGEAGLKILIMGVRYVPTATESDLIAENEFQNQDGVGVGTYEIDGQMVDDTFFRRGGLFQKFYKRTFTLGNQVIADEDIPGNANVEAHEMSHRAQNREFGIIGFNTRYVLDFFKNGSRGGNVFENYRYLPHTHSPLCAPLHANTGSPLGLRVFEGGMGTTSPVIVPAD